MKILQIKPLHIYLAVGDLAISSVLLQEENRNHTPFYYVSRVLRGAELKYLEIEKAALTLIVTVKRLQPYFMSHKVIVLTNLPLKEVIGKPEMSGRLVRWAFQLTEYDIEFIPRTAIKAQALTDFMCEMTKPTEGDVPPSNNRWVLFVDGSSSYSRAGMGIVLINPNSYDMEFAICLNFRASNNEAEYEAFLRGLRMAIELGATNVLIHIDSELVHKQVIGEFEVKEERMKKYAEKFKELEQQLRQLEIVQIPRHENPRAD